MTSWRTFGTLSGGTGTVLLVACLTGCGSGGSDAGSAGTGGSGTATGGQGGSGGFINTDSGIGGSGASSGSGGAGGQPHAGCGDTVTGTVRDFHAGHPDFQCEVTGPPGFVDVGNKDCGPWDPLIVGPLGSIIGPDRKPVYASSTRTPSSTGASNFSQWYTDVPDVNMSKSIDLKLVPGTDGTFVYDTAFFFPIDGQLFDADPNNPDRGPYKSDDGQVRNFHFTYELHTTFQYDPGNVFTFRGDDDVFVYINDRLAMNLGGIHVPLQGTLNLDTGRVEVTAPMGFPDLPVLADVGFTESIDGGVAGKVDLQLTPGEVYNMDFFFAERNCCASNFRFETNFVFIDCGPK
jgi:fibro-slime domain-containing protein